MKKMTVSNIAEAFGFSSCMRGIANPEVGETFFYDAARGGMCHRPLIAEGEGFRFVYSVASNGQEWNPFEWRARPDVNPIEILFSLSWVTSKWSDEIERWIEVVNGPGAGFRHERVIAATLGVLGLQQKRSFPFSDKFEGLPLWFVKKFFQFLIKKELEILGEDLRGLDLSSPAKIFRHQDEKDGHFVVIGDQKSFDFYFDSRDINISSIPIDNRGENKKSAEKVLRRRILRSFKENYPKLLKIKWSPAGGGCPSRKHCWKAMLKVIQSNTCCSEPDYISKSFGFSGISLGPIGKKVFIKLAKVNL